jgi:hypothetical protein
MSPGASEALPWDTLICEEETPWQRLLPALARTEKMRGFFIFIKVWCSLFVTVPKHLKKGRKVYFGSGFQRFLSLVLVPSFLGLW